jgi:hypothetical protein
MKKLPAVVKKYGLTHTQVKESEEGYIYEVFSQGAPSGFDVFRKKTTKDREATIKGRKIQFRAGEKYPNDNAFGEWAWHCRTLEKAVARLEGFANEN